MAEICYIAMSGGVDSAAAAVLLIEQGYEVRGVTLRLKPGSLADADIADAQEASAKLGIPLDVLDLRDEFRERVTEPFIREYLCGRTPSPCLGCNVTVKFAYILTHALKNGANYIATGHYAVCEQAENGEYILKKGISKKDQSYFLAGLSTQTLSHTLFPLGRLTKDDARRIAQSAGLSLAHKKDSTEVCFIPDNDYCKYIEDNSTELPPPGFFTDRHGAILGEHGGIYRYTIGQRKGLGAFGEPKYVTALDSTGNRVILGSNEELFCSGVQTLAPMWISGRAPDAELTAQVKIRSAATPAQATVTQAEGGLKITFEAKQRAAAPGQAAVIYNGDTVLGYGVISNAYATLTEQTAKA